MAQTNTEIGVLTAKVDKKKKKSPKSLLCPSHTPNQI